MNDCLSGCALEYAIKRISTKSPKREGRLIVVEGLDGSGKTTTVRGMAEALHGRALSSPISSIHRETRAAIDDVAFTDPLRRFHFYLDANRYDSEHILKPALAAGEIIVLDRYVLSTVIAHNALGADLNADPQMSSPDEADDIVVPDVTLFIRLDTAERIRRLLKRNETIPNTKFDADVNLQERMASMYSQLTCHGLVDVDVNGYK